MDTQRCTVASALDLRSIFWGNLLLLGFKPDNASINKNVFNSHSPAGGKAMEAVVRFLFGVLDEKEADSRFAKCWPITDRNQARDFRNIVIKWLEAMKKEGQLPPDVTIRKSHFDECRGERFERTLWALSSLALRVALSREVGADGMEKIGECMLKNNEELKTQSISNHQTFLRECTARGDQQKRWESYGTKLTSEYEEVKQRKKGVSLKRARLDNSFIKLFGDAVPINEALKHRDECLSNIRQHRKRMAKWMHDNQENVETIGAYVNGRMKTHTLMGNVPRSGPGHLTGPPKGVVDLTEVAKRWGEAHAELAAALRSYFDERKGVDAIDHNSMEGLSDAFILLNDAEELKRQLEHEFRDVTAKVEKESANYRVQYAKRHSLPSTKPSSPTSKSFTQTYDGTTSPFPLDRKAQWQSVRTPPPPTFRKTLSSLTTTPEAVQALQRSVVTEMSAKRAPAEEAAAATTAGQLRERVLGVVSSNEGRREARNRTELGATGQARSGLLIAAGSSRKTGATITRRVVPAPVKPPPAPSMVKQATRAESATDTMQRTSAGKNAHVTLGSRPTLVPSKWQQRAQTTADINFTSRAPFDGSRTADGESLIPEGKSKPYTRNDTQISNTAPTASARPKRFALIPEVLPDRSTPLPVPPVSGGSILAPHSALKSSRPLLHTLPEAGNEPVSKSTLLAYDRLCEQIVDFVNNDIVFPGALEPSIGSDFSNDPVTVVAEPRCIDAREALSGGSEDPISALGTAAFAPRAEIPRTPEKDPPRAIRPKIAFSPIPSTPPPVRSSLSSTPQAATPLSATAAQATTPPQSTTPSSPTIPPSTLSFLLKAAMYKPKTPSKLSQPVIFSPDSSIASDDLDSHGGAEIGVPMWTTVDGNDSQVHQRLDAASVKEGGDGNPDEDGLGIRELGSMELSIELDLELGPDESGFLSFDDD
ncbi:HAUS augmin-like complex subunit 6 N-terminus-domain-containing protein [Fimicolochytrium jonesii]|uniref:HAUS augmin-like complex subunit 6 N-terminus-domain-containing protein n=1 Tax=Fimicolochytrium jonesii TaxID=1396493 RepID=UPI0022FE897A|nr:HAUS augmin-like complex subunit 6 N-terminus-domain-containing protein [Fimicolochytrium jonesii]KAI8820978.1 HAUS augmin-like complex subunit 6 N-terminus-domain-containing protein [Fimicolochytrium jonesii]